MNLKSFGCSFIYGTELSDDGRGNPSAKPSKISWPGQLAQHLNYKHQCYARPGQGNLYILEQLLNQVEDTNSLFVIGWTWIDRFDYKNPTSDEWTALTPVATGPIAQSYYQNLHSEHQDKLSTLINIRVAIDILKEKKHPFIMTYMDDLMFDIKWHVSPAIIQLQNYIRPYMTTFDNQTFLEWSKKNGYAIGTGLHPLDDAHIAAGKYMLKVFDKQKTSGLVQ
jgi:hypothetical protein